MTTIIVPIVHDNGTSRTELLDLREAAYDAVNLAVQRITQMAPTARDYYLQAGLYEKAVEQHRRRIRSLMDMLREIETEMDFIAQ